MFDENFVFDFEHKIAGNQLWSHRWSGSGHGLEHIWALWLNLPFIALLWRVGIAVHVRDTLNK